MFPLKQRTKGMLIAAGGVTVLSPDSLLIRLIDLDLWSLGFMRGGFVAVFTFALLILMHRHKSLAELFRFDAPAWGIAVCMAVGTLSFVKAIQTTSVAHTLIIVGAIPMITAFLAYVFIRETISRSTQITSVVVFLCLIVVVYDGQDSTMEGDTYALFAAVALSLSFVLARRTRIPDRMATVSVGGLMISLACLPWVSWTGLQAEQVALSGLLGAFVAGAYVLFMWAPRYIEAAEVAIFLPLETVFGILLVWWFLSEEPSLHTIVGGLGVVLAITFNSALQLRASHAPGHTI